METSGEKTNERTSGRIFWFEDYGWRIDRSVTKKFEIFLKMLYTKYMYTVGCNIYIYTKNERNLFKVISTEGGGGKAALCDKTDLI